MDYSRLEKGIIDFIQEEQVKLGYRKEKIRLYYPLSSVNHFLEEDVDGKKTEKLEEEFQKACGESLGRVEVSRNKDRFCFVVPEEGAEYVREHMEENAFIKKLVTLLQSHSCTIEAIYRLFLETGEKIHFEEIETEDFDYLIYFENGEDSYYYCFKDEGCHIIYHRFMPEDYRDLFSDSVE